MQTLERSPSVFDAVQDALKTHIVEHGLRPGDMLEPEGRIAERLGVSRVTVREAVKALSSLGILESRRGSGVFVRESLTHAVRRDHRPWPDSRSIACACRISARTG